MKPTEIAIIQALNALTETNRQLLASNAELLKHIHDTEVTRAQEKASRMQQLMTLVAIAINKLEDYLEQKQKAEVPKTQEPASTESTPQAEEKKPLDKDLTPAEIAQNLKLRGFNPKDTTDLGNKKQE